MSNGNEPSPSAGEKAQDSAGRTAAKNYLSGTELLQRLEEFEARIVSYESLYQEIQSSVPSTVSFGWLVVDCQPAKRSLLVLARKWRMELLEWLSKNLACSICELDAFMERLDAGMKDDAPIWDYDHLVKMMEILMEVRERGQQVTEADFFDPLRRGMQLLKKYGHEVVQEHASRLEALPLKFSALSKTYFSIKEKLAPLQNEEIKRIGKQEEDFLKTAEQLRNHFLATAPFQFALGDSNAYEAIDGLDARIRAMESELDTLADKQRLFQLMINSGRPIRECRTDLQILKKTWDVVSLIMHQIEDWKEMKLSLVDTEDIQDQAKSFSKDIKSLDKKARAWDVFSGLELVLKNFLKLLPLVQDLRNPWMRERHWKMLMKRTNTKFELSSEFKLRELLELNLHEFVSEVESIVDRANNERNIEKSLQELESTWKKQAFEFVNRESEDRAKSEEKVAAAEQNESNGSEASFVMIKVPEELIENLEDHQVMLQNISSSRFAQHFSEELSLWQRRLGSIDSIITLFSDVQKTWSYLETIFVGSEDIRAQLPLETERFARIDEELRSLLGKSRKASSVLEVCSIPDLEPSLSSLSEQLSICEKALSEYLETKRRAFPRFYFVSVPDLLDILSKGGKSASSVQNHMPKLFQAIQRLEFEKHQPEDLEASWKAIGMWSREGEYVQFIEPCTCTGKVEDWLNKLLGSMKQTLRHLLSEAIASLEEKPREHWLFEHIAQLVLVGSQVQWTSEVGNAFDSLEEGNDAALRDYSKKQVSQLNSLIGLIQTNLSKGDRQKIMSFITLDVHARDVVLNLIRDKIDSFSSFAWQCQLRQYWDEKTRECQLKICDASFNYGYEYLGNGSRLVITPLTDRIYITLTQSLRLILGGAPAGPAGTGKTETTKDLGSQLGKPVYVFNCSDQMDYRSLGDIFKGLSMSGSWACFDEFNRIAVEVLSVVSTQFKSILDAIKENKATFNFQGEEIRLDKTCAVFITMNPGYLGRYSFSPSPFLPLYFY